MQSSKASDENNLKISLGMEVRIVIASHFLYFVRISLYLESFANI